MMSRDLKLFLIIVIGGFVILGGSVLLTSFLTEYFYSNEINNDEKLASLFVAQAKLERELQLLYPLLTKEREQLTITPKAAFSLYIPDAGDNRTLFRKNSEAVLPIASITKLMTALVALEEYEVDDLIFINPIAVNTAGEAGGLQVGDVFSVRDLLYLSLLESSNDAAIALTDPLGYETFIQKMNKKAASLNLENTKFINPTGLDESTRSNVSTTEELVELTQYLLDTQPQIFDILSQRELPLYRRDGSLHHIMRNTNQLLGYYEWPTDILGGKTGTTKLAGQALLFVVESPDDKGYIVNVLLGSESRFEEMRSLLQWTLHTYDWKPRN